MILAIDQGTTGTTCIVFDDEGKPAGSAAEEFEQHFPRPGWVEHDAAEAQVTDYSNASRTLLFDIRKRVWDEELCEVLNVPVGSLPEALPNAHVYGETTEFGGKPVGAWPATSRPRSTARAATSRAWARTRKAPAPSCCRTRARARRCSSRG